MKLGKMNDFSNINLAGANIKNLNFGSVKETNVKHCTNVVTGDNAVFTVNKTEIRGGTVDGPETRSVPAQKPEKPGTIIIKTNSNKCSRNN